MSKQTLTPNRPTRTPANTRTPAGRTAANRATTRKSQTAVIRPFHMPFEQKNVLLIVAGVAVILLGYAIMWLSPTMSFGALTLSPIVLLLGYCVIVPLGIMAGSKTFKKDTEAASTQATAANGTV